MQASMTCTRGTQATIAVDPTMLEAVPRGDFKGINTTPSCNVTSDDIRLCFITICSGVVTLRDSRVSWKKDSRPGSLLCVVSDSRLEVYNSRFSDNSVRPLAIYDQARVMLHGSTVSNNVAGLLGGGILVLGDAHVTIAAGSRVHGNRALPVKLISDKDALGGGLFVSDNARVAIDGRSSVSNNTSGGLGGGLLVLGNASITITGGSTVQGNTANFGGGGVFAAGNARVIPTNGSCVQDNTAYVGGGLYVTDSSKVAIANSNVQGNTANTAGGGLWAWFSSEVTITNSSVWGNTAEIGGGGLLVAGTSALTITSGSHVRGNTATSSGGGLVALGNASVALTNHSIVHHNRALDGSGGGILVSDAAALNISGDCSIVNNTSNGGVGGGICVGVYDAGMLRFGSMGRREYEGISLANATSTARVIISGSRVANNTSNGAAGGGVAIVAKSHVELANGTLVVGNTAINGSGGAAIVADDALLQGDTTVVFADNSVSRKYVGSMIVAFDNAKLFLPSRGQLTKCSPGVYLGRTPCGVGELLQHDVCVCCPAHTFSFTNSSTCLPCPPNARCSWGSVVDPLPGYWKSAATSTQMHRCPLFKTACDYYTDGNSNHMCKAGYQGPLCGECQLPDYGMLSPMRCGKCMKPTVQLGLYLLFGSVVMLFIAYTIHATWQDNTAGHRTVQMTDLIKVLVQFMQYLVIIGSVSVPWPLFDVQQWLQAVDIVVTLGSGQALSLDCWLHYYFPYSKLPITIQRHLVYFLAPVFTFAACIILQCLVWAMKRCLVPLLRLLNKDANERSPFLVLRKLPVTVLVLVYYVYPTLIRASLSFFACLDIDKAVTPSEAAHGITAPLSHRWGYWVSSIEQQCFAGYHLGWSMGLGLPAVLLWCVVVPVSMGVGLCLCRGRADTDRFREHFGFMYRTYRPERMYWEAVWAARTVLLTCIAVFAFPMQRYYSVLSLLLVFLLSAALPVVFMPYAVSTLHHMHLISTSCLAITTMGALAMFAYDIQESTAFGLRMAITVLVFIMNLACVVCHQVDECACHKGVGHQQACSGQVVGA